MHGLKKAKAEFLQEPANRSAGKYLKALLSCEAFGYLRDDEFLDGLSAIQHFLLNHPRKKREAAPKKDK